MTSGRGLDESQDDPAGKWNCCATQVEALDLHDLPRRPPYQAALHQPAGAPQREIKRRTEVVGIFPNQAAIVRLVSAILPEQNDRWAVQRCCYMTLESVVLLSDDPIVSLPTMAA